MSRLGLLKNRKNYLEIFSFSERFSPLNLYQQSKNFYKIFEENFEKHLHVALHNYCLSIELMLKAILVWKGESIENIKIHQLIKLLKKAKSHYPVLSEIEDNSEYELVLQELGNFFNEIRYLEVGIILSCKKEFLEIANDIFRILRSSFEEELKNLSAQAGLI